MPRTFSTSVYSSLPLLLIVATTLTILCDPRNANAQDTHAGQWQSPTQDRLEGIFEKGEWRAKTFNGEWLPDSSAYLIRQRAENAEEQQVFRVDVRTGEEQIATVTPSLPNLLSPDQKTKLEFESGNLIAHELKSGNKTPLTQNASDREIHLHSISWSPDSSQVVFVESDYTDVRKRSVLVPGDPSYPDVREDRFARIGEKIPMLRVGVVDREGKNLRWLSLAMPTDTAGTDGNSADGFYLGQVEWAGNHREVVVERLSRFRDRRDFLLFDVESGKAQRLFSETNDAWVTASQGTELGLMWLAGGKRFIVITEKDGWRHAYLYARDGTEISNLTPGEYDIIERAVVDEPNGWFYFYASPTNATQRYLYRVPLDGTGMQQRLTPADQPGTHAYTFSPDASWAFHTYSTFDKPPVTDLISLPDHRSLRVLEDNKALQEVAQKWISHPTEFLQLNIGEKISLDAWMIKPKDFDASKKYPLFVYVYGEPHAQTVLDSWGAAQSHFLRVVADLGYVVVSIDNRGTPAPKGSAWRRAIFGSLGPLSTEEQAAALPKLAELCPSVDLSRVGIWGWSGGGSNTLNALFRKPDQYHVGIAVVPKPQPHLYNAWFQEIYMRTPAVNPEGYQRSAPLHFAEGLKGKLLIITGSGETNTHIQIIEGLVDRLIELGKPFDYMVYPNRDHGLREGRGSEVHVRMLITRYLLNNLPAGPR
jgi:dipeptidyl-peptidase-4